MTRSFILVSALKDLKRRIADPVALVLALSIPLLVGGLMALVSGPSQQARGVVFLADPEEGFPGRVVENALQQGPLASLFEVQRVTEADGRTKLNEGQATALVIVPAGAADAILDEKPLALTLVTNPAQRILPGIVQESMELIVEAAFYVQRLFREPLRLAARERAPGEDFPPDAEIADIATSFAGRLRTISPLVFPPALEVRFAEGAAAPQEDTFAAFGRIFLPGLLFMSLLFIAQSMSGDVWEEQTLGTLRRAMSAPPGVLRFLLGKLAAGAVLMAGVSAMGLLVGIVLFGVPAARAIVALPWTVFAGAVLLAIFLLPQVTASSQRFANMLVSLMVFPLMMIGGSFFPFEAMPPWMAAAGRWTPNGQGVAQLAELLNGTAEATALLLAAVAMGVPAVASVAWTTHRLRRRFEGGS